MKPTVSMFCRLDNIGHGRITGNKVNWHINIILVAKSLIVRTSILECSCFCSRANGQVTGLIARQRRGGGCTALYLLL